MIFTIILGFICTICCCSNVFTLLCFYSCYLEGRIVCLRSLGNATINLSNIKWCRTSIRSEKPRLKDDVIQEQASFMIRLRVGQLLSQPRVLSGSTPYIHRHSSLSSFRTITKASMSHQTIRYITNDVRYMFNNLAKVAITSLDISH